MIIILRKWYHPADSNQSVSKQNTTDYIIPSKYMCE